MTGENKMTGKIIRYESKGVVLGNLWGGEKGWYPAKPINAPTRAQIKEKVKEGVKKRVS